MAGRIEIRAEVTGNVWAVEAPAGTTVAADDPIVILESMKMEIPVEAPAAGKVAELLVGKGDAVQEDQLLAVLETD